MNNVTHGEWLKLPTQTRQNIFREVGIRMNLPPAAVEKDWWVVKMLELVFESSIALHTVFKGGTSLSKAWQLIDRFSEDIDLAIDRSFLGFTKPMNGSQVSKLRRTSYKFISEEFYPEIQAAFENSGLDGVTITLAEAKNPDQDPLIIEIYYPALSNTVSYLRPRVLIEIGSRSLIEPFTPKLIRSFADEHFDGRPFAGAAISIPTVNPERTFLEKIFLLHEEFQQPLEKVRINRKSRHLYDLEKLMDTSFAATATADEALYQHIVEHRRTLTPLRGIDYAHHSPDKINPLPPESLLADWEADYKAMQESMFYKSSLAFPELIGRIRTLKERINALTWVI